MSECTKGKMSVKRIGSKLFIMDDKGFSVTKVRYSKKAEANAEELVLRWNAFEEGGLVEELRDAFGELAATFVGLPEGSIGGQALKKAEAALAKS